MKLIGSETLESIETQKHHSWMLLPILVLGENSKERKNRIVQELEELEIETRPVLTGNFLAQPAIKRIISGVPREESFKNATYITNNAFLVGAHHDMTELQINFLCESLNDIDK